MNGINRCIPSLLVVLLLIITSLNPLIDNVFADPGSTNDPFSFVPDDGVQDDKEDNGTKIKIKDIIKDKIINLLHNTWSYNINFTEVQVNVTGDRVQLLITHPEIGNVTLDMNFTYGKGKTFIKTKDKEKISYKTNDLTLNFSANISAFKEIIIVEKEKDKLFPLNWSVNVTSEWGMNISRNDRIIQVGGVDVFWLQAFTAVNATNGTVILNETYSEGNSSFNISLDLGQVVDKDDYPLNIDPTVTIDVTDTFDFSTRNIAVNSSGIMYTAYYDGSRVEYQTSSDGGLNWGSATTVYTDSGIKQVVMCIDSDDNLHFLWKESDFTTFHKCYWVGNTTWSDPFYVRDEVGNWHNLVPDGSGNVYAFYAGVSGMEWRVWDGDSWSAEGTIRADQGTPDEQHPEAVISSNGTIHLVWGGTDTGVTGIYYSRSTDGSAWSTPLQIDGNLGGAWQPSIVVDSNDDLHVNYQGKNATHAQTQIIYLKYDASGSSWSSEEYLTDANTIQHRFPTISLDGADCLYSIWSNTVGNDQIDLRYSGDGGTTWSAVETLIDRTYASRNPNTLHYAYPADVGNIPEEGFMFSYREDCTGSPDYTIYYSSNWSLSPSGPGIIISDEYPPDLGFTFPQPWCYATVNRSAGGEFNVTFWENSTGSWINRQENNTVTNGTFWWQYTQASSNGTDYFWKVMGENGSDNLSSIFQFATFQDVNDTGEPITDFNLFQYSGGSIIDVHDLINDTANYTVIFEPYRESAGWIGNGAPSITKVDTTWYIVHRQRTGDTDRGHYLLLNSSTDLESWPSVWNVSIDDVSPANPISFEKASMRFYNNYYYLYFCVDSGTMWSSYYIKADTAAGLESELGSSNSWTLIKAGAKDPEVVYHNGTYYFITSDGLYKDDNPDGSSIEFIVDFTQLYKNTYGGGVGDPGNNTGTIFFDNTSGYFIYWRGVRVDFDDDAQVDDILWYFAISGDMETWESADRHVKVKNYTETSGTLRYPAYFVTASETVCIVEWENDLGSGNRAVVLWVYPTDESNDPPEFSSENPTNETIGISLQSWCSVAISDPDAESFDVTWEENSTGPWVVRQQNLTETDGTFWWQFTQASVQNTQYWWRVSANDGTDNISIIYTFNTNAASTISNPGPANESIGILIQPWCDITVNDLEGDSMTVNWYEYSTATWVIRQTNSTASNGTYWWQYTQADAYPILYFWRVDVLDGEFNTSVIYEFTTDDSPTQSDPHPANETIGVSIQHWCSITVNDLEGDSMTVNWYENSTDVWIIRQTNSSASNGTYWWEYTQSSSYSTLYFWRVDVLENGFNTSVMYEFTTDTPSTQSNPGPTNESIGISLQPWCDITVNDLEGDSMTVNWYENSTDVWILRETNATASNGTYWWQYTQANTLSTLYYWRVDVIDDDLNTSVIYEFTTDTASTQSDPHPVNETIGVQLQPWCDITVNDLEGDSMTVNWYENSTDVWILRQTNASAPNGTYWWEYSQSSEYSTLYYWRVDVLDDDLNTSVIYEFTTGDENFSPEFSSESPINTTTGVALQPWCHIIIEDPEGDTFNVTWYENSTASWVQRQENLTVTNGTFWWQFTQASSYSTTYYWKLVANDTNGNENVTIYHFTTLGNTPPVGSSPFPSNGSLGIALTPTCRITASDANGDLMDISWLENTTGPWVERHEDTGVSDGEQTFSFTQFSSYSTTYYWRINLTDGTDNVTYIFHFTTNTLPEFSSESPTNESSGISLQPWCHVQINDADGDTFNVTWEENSTGPWVVRQENLTSSNGTFWWRFLQASGYSTTYYWRVSANDSTNNNTTIYHFTTELNPQPEQSSPSPVNDSSEISLGTWCSITVNDPNGDNFDVNFYENSTGSWVNRQTNGSVSNGTFWWHFTQALSYSTTYYWNVTANDGVTNVSETYHFITVFNTAPSISNPVPINETSGISLQPWCHVTVNDLEGDTFNITWYENSTGSWVQRQQNLTSSNGTLWWRFIQASSYSITYYWRVISNDSYGNQSVVIYHFTTLGNTLPVGSSPFPLNESLGVTLIPTCRITVFDDDGDSMNISWLENTTGFWIERHADGEVSDGTYSFQITQFSDYSTAYYWRINLTDGTNNVTYIFHFTMMDNIAPTIGSPIPTNGSIGISASPTTSITVGDIDEMIVDWLEWNGDAWVLIQRTTNLTSGTYNWVYLNASVQSTTYYWMVNVTDGALNTTETYHFTSIITNSIEVNQWDPIYQMMIWAIGLLIIVGVINVFRRFGYRLVSDFT